MSASAYVDGLQAGVMAHRGGTMVYVNDAFCALVGRPRASLLGQHFATVVTPEEASRLRDTAARRARGEPVPDTWQSVDVLRGDGTRKTVEVSVSRAGEDMVCLVRDVSEAAGRRARRLALSHLGVSIHALRTEAEVMQALRDGVRAAGLWSAWLVPFDDDRLRVVYGDGPGAAAFEATVGRAMAGYVGAWTAWLRRAWVEGEAYSDDAIDELGRFYGASWQGMAQAIAMQHGLTRALALRIDAGAEPRGILVLRGAWLHPDDLAVASLLRTHVSAALENVRYLLGAHRQLRDLETVNQLARRLLAEGAHSSARVVEAATTGAREALGASGCSLLLLDGDGETLRIIGGDGRGQTLALSSTTLAREALEGAGAVTVDDVSTDPRTCVLTRDARATGSALVVVLASESGARGLLAVHDAGGRRFGGEDVALARALAGVTAVALENAELHEEARARLRELRDTQARLVERERLAVLGEVAAVVAHEVRNPLGVIFNAVSSLRRRAQSDAVATGLLDIVREEAGRLNLIVGDLLDYARPTAPERRPEPLGPLVSGALSAAFARAQSSSSDGSRVAATVDVPDDAPLARVDGRQVRQALLNLFINAIESMPDGGALRVAARALPGGERVRVTVSDTGGGIAPEARTKVFEPFFTTRATGTGLGLAVVKRIVEAHGGAVTIEDTPGGGTTFVLDLPAA